MTKYAAAVTLYNPKPEYLANVRNYLNDFDEIFLYDNSNDNSGYGELIPQQGNIHYYFYGINKGLPYAFNTVLNSSSLNGCDFLCTLDQDSQFEGSEIKKIKQFIEDQENNDVAIIAPHIIYSHKAIQPKERVAYKDWVICSGSFINLEIVRKHHIRYDEKYFIDRFEVDFCKQLVLLNYKIIVFGDAILKQELGMLNRRYANHSPLRHYYLFRNRLYFNYKFFNAKKAFLISSFQIAKHIAIILACENTKTQKVKACLHGYCDYKNKMFYKSLLDESDYLCK